MASSLLVGMSGSSLVVGTSSLLIKVKRPPAACFHCMKCVSLGPVVSPKGWVTPVAIEASSLHGLHDRHAHTSPHGIVRATIWGSLHMVIEG